MATLRLIYGLAILAALAIGGFKVLPPYFANYQFEEAIKAEAVQATNSVRSADEIRENVVKLAGQHGIQITANQVQVSRTGSVGTGTVTIGVDYSVPLDFPGHSITLQFHPATQNSGVMHAQ